MNTLDLKDKWEEILHIVKTEYEVSDIQFNTWLKPLEVHEVQEKKGIIIVPDEQRVSINIISKRYKTLLQITICEMFNIPEFEVQFVLQNDVPKAPVRNVKAPTVNDQRASEAKLNPKYTFDTFIVGNNNKFAHAAALAVADSPGETYNPLFIYGGAGLGKTHLMHSIGHYIIENNKNSKVLYVSSEDFTNEVIDAIRKGATATANVRDKYRNIDVLLIDDIQFIIGKESTQNEFFNTFNALHTAKKQIVISSDKPPKQMEILEERFRSRFEWGLLADITVPDYETCVAILHKKEELEGYTISDEVIHYIASNVNSNIRELEGAFNKVMASAKLNNQEVTLQLAEEALKDIISPNQKKTVTPEYIISVVSEHFNVTPEDLAGNKRTTKIVLPRQIAMYLCREITGTPLKTIGHILGNRDHTTIMSGIRKIENDLQKDSTLKNTVEVLNKKINP